MKLAAEKATLIELADILKSRIKNRTDFWSDFTVIVPSIKIEAWFKAYWLKTEKDVLMNVTFKTIDKALIELIDFDSVPGGCASAEDIDLISREELKLLIMKHVVSSTVSTLPPLVTDYIKDSLGNIQGIKLYDFSDKMAQLFLEYDMECFTPTGWELDLYNEVMSEAWSIGRGTLRSIYNRCKVLKATDFSLLFLGFSSFSAVQQMLIDAYARFADVEILSLIDDSAADKTEDMVIAAPSKLREIEILHGKICALLEETTINNGKNELVNKYNDFLVLAPSINEYETTIKRVFEQDGTQFPNIPYSVNDRIKIETDVVSAIKVLYDIALRGFFTRMDFYELVNNKAIQKTRGISSDDVEGWTDAILSMGVYRSHASFDDWDYSKKRAILSKIAYPNDVDENIVELSGKEYIPYSSINVDDTSMHRFVSIVDDLRHWLDVAQSIQYVNNTGITSLKEEFDHWFSHINSDNEETNYRYKKILNAMDLWLSFNMPQNVIPIDTLFYLLYKAGEINHFSGGDFFTKGITFTGFDESSILSAKYVFFLDAGSSKLPAENVKSELDQRPDPVGDKYNRTKRAFAIQAQNAERFKVSFINKDLKKDEDFFLSPLVNAKNTELVSIDEVNDWDKLFTKKEYKNKDYYQGLLGGSSAVTKGKRTAGKMEYPKKLSTNNLAEFIKEPLSATIKRMFGWNDNSDADLRNEYEPFTMNNLESARLLKAIIAEDVRTRNMVKDSVLNSNYDRQNKLPNIAPQMKVKAERDILSNINKLKDKIVEVMGNGYEIVDFDDLKLTSKLRDWILTSSGSVIKKEEGNDISYIELKKLPKTERDEDFMLLYITALMDVASKDDENTFNVKLYKNGFNGFSVTPSLARETLNHIYEAMNDYDNIKFLELNQVNNNDDKPTYDEFLDSVMSQYNGPWKYFAYKKMLDIESQIGYSKQNFANEYAAMKDLIRDLVLFPLEWVSG